MQLATEAKNSFKNMHIPTSKSVSAVLQLRDLICNHIKSKAYFLGIHRNEAGVFVTWNYYANYTKINGTKLFACFQNLFFLKTDIE